MSATWEFECAEPETGLREAITHACWTNDDAEPATTTDVQFTTTGDVVRVTTTWTCPVCQATTTTEEQQPADHFEEPRYDDE
jgi:hypothetical protein